MNPERQVAILHYSAPPVIGGVEAVIQAQARVFLQNGFPVTLIAGRGGEVRHEPGEPYNSIILPLMDSQNPQILQASEQLGRGVIPADFEALRDRLVEELEPVLQPFEVVILHNLFSKHFNLPLTAALARLVATGAVHGCIAWCHDFSWTSPNSRKKVHPGYPWDLLRTALPHVTYVVVSEQRRTELASLWGPSPRPIAVVYNGVDPQQLLGLSPAGWALAQRMDLLDCDLALLMPVRVTRAKNIEYALQVIAAIKARGPDPRLVLTGPPDPHEPQSLAYFGELLDLRRKLDVEREMRFVYESGPQPGEPYFAGPELVGELYRVCDLVLLTSLREGFGMPVLEAGLVGAPVVSPDIPAAREIGGEQVTLIDISQDAGQTAGRILELINRSAVYRLRRRVRQQFTWQKIFERDVRPLLEKVIGD